MKPGATTRPAGVDLLLAGEGRIGDRRNLAGADPNVAYCVETGLGIDNAPVCNHEVVVLGPQRHQKARHEGAEGNNSDADG